MLSFLAQPIIPQAIKSLGSMHTSSVSASVQRCCPKGSCRGSRVWATGASRRYVPDKDSHVFVPPPFQELRIVWPIRACMNTNGADGYVPHERLCSVSSAPALDQVLVVGQKRVCLAIGGGMVGAKPSPAISGEAIVGVGVGALSLGRKVALQWWAISTVVNSTLL